jgi:hypothetical protein
MMWDYYPDIRVIVRDDSVEGGLRTVGTRELLPWAYDAKAIRGAGKEGTAFSDD